MLALFTCDSDVILSGRETIYRNNEACGWLSSAGYGHTIGKSVGMGYVRHNDGVTREYLMAGEYELEVATVRVKAQLSLEPLIDPEMQNIKV